MLPSESNVVGVGEWPEDVGILSTVGSESGKTLTEKETDEWLESRSVMER